MKFQRFWWQALGLLAVLGAPSAGFAADPVQGTSKFAQKCSGCHSVGSTATVDRGRNSPTMISNAIAGVGAMSFLSSLTTTELEDIAAYLGNAPSSVTFAQTTVGQTSATQTVTVRASRIAALGNLAASVSGDFTRTGGTCGSTLAASQSCTITLSFSPTAAGSRSGSLSITHDGLTTAVPIALSGTAVAAPVATISLNANTLAFGNQTVNTTSAGQTLTVSNTGTAALDFSAITLGGAAAADYSSTGGCAVGTAVAAGGSCTLSVRFTPSTTGSRAATLSLASNASNGAASVSLSGTGQAVPTPRVSLSKNSVAFGSVVVGASATTQSVTLSNTGDAVLNISAIDTALPFSATNNCGSTLAAGANCSISVGFTPAAAGAASGSLNITTDASGSPHAVSLSGTGTLAPTGTLAWDSSSALAFGNVAVGDDAATQTLTLTNSGDGAATLGALAITGAQAADFRIDGASTCAANLVLATGEHCTAVIGFSPAATGARSASLALTATNSSVPDALALGGTGTAPAAPALTLSAQTFSFIAPASGTAAAQALTLSNTGNADLHLSALTVDNAHFAVTGSGGCGATPITIAAGANCTVSVSWVGTANSADETAELTIAGDMQPASATVALSGEGSNDTPSNDGGGGCTLGAGTGAADPLLLLMAAVAALLAWRRRRNAA